MKRKSTLELITTSNPISLTTKVITTAGLISIPYTGAFGFLVAFWAGGHEAIMLGGLRTKKVYERTCEHIEKFHRLDKRFFKKVMGKDRGDETMGYCQLQGMYLAAKQYNLLEDFYEYKQKYTRNNIPNFELV